MLLVCHLAEAATPGLADRAERAAALLSAQPGCRWVEVGRAVDDPAAWVLVARFDSVPAYRRALGPFDVREHVVPLQLRGDRIVVPQQRIESDPDGSD